MAVETLAKIPGRQMLEVRRPNWSRLSISSLRGCDQCLTAEVVADDGVDILQAVWVQKPRDPNLRMSMTIEYLSEMLLMFMLDHHDSCCYIHLLVSSEPCLGGTIGSVDWSPIELCRFSGEILYGRANFSVICGVILNNLPLLQVVSWLFGCSTRRLEKKVFKEMLGVWEHNGALWQEPVEGALVLGRRTAMQDQPRENIWKLNELQSQCWANWSYKLAFYFARFFVCIFQSVSSNFFKDLARFR